MGVVSSKLSGVSPTIGLTRKVTWNHKEHSGDYGQPFVSMLISHYIYGSWISVPTTYELKLVHRLPNLHWFLLIRKDLSSCPYFSVEVTTSDWNDLIPLTRDLALKIHLI